VAVLTRAIAVALLGLLGLAACYRPDTRSCTVTCADPGDCAGGQTCSDGWCVAPEAAGTCAAPADADPGRPDGPPGAIDAGADAAPATLHVVVQGRGKVVVDPLGVECLGTQGTPGDCLFPVGAGTTQTLLPVETNPNSPFVGWTTANCLAEPGACTLDMDGDVVLVGASFE
jgi:hypothetical protein